MYRQEWPQYRDREWKGADAQKAPPQKDNKKPILRISEEGSVEIRRPFFLRISEEGADSRLAVRAPAIWEVLGKMISRYKKDLLWFLFFYQKITLIFSEP